MFGFCYCLPNHSWNWLNRFLSLSFTFPFSSNWMKYILHDIEVFLFRVPVINLLQNNKLRISFWVFRHHRTHLLKICHFERSLSTVWLSACYWGLKMIFYVAICSSRSSGFVDFHHLTTEISSTDNQTQEYLLGLFWSNKWWERTWSYSMNFGFFTWNFSRLIQLLKGSWMKLKLIIAFFQTPIDYVLGLSCFFTD